MPRGGFPMMAKVIFCATCLVLADGWPMQGTQVREDQLEGQRVVAVGSERIEWGRYGVRILYGNQRVDLPRFRELLVVNIVGPETSLERFYGRQAGGGCEIPEKAGPVGSVLQRCGGWRGRRILSCRECL